MGPKKKSGKSTTRSQAVSLDEEINTHDWKCLVTFAAEKDKYSSYIVNRFLEGASTGFRREIKTVTLSDILHIVKDFEENTLNYKNRFLLNFKTIFEEAVEILKENEGNPNSIPLPLISKMVKAVIRMFKEDDVERREKMKLGPVDPITAMKKKPLAPPAKPKTKPVKPPKGGGKDKKGKNTAASVTVAPPSPTKEDTKLLKRGEEPKDTQLIIDDSPVDGFQLYILLAQFYDPELPLELIKIGVPIHGFLCLNSGPFGLNRISSTFKFDDTEDINDTKVNEFWDSFLKILWDRELIPNFKEIIFEVYTPKYLPKKKEHLQKFLFREISFLLYDMSDVKRQQKNYFRHLKVWDVSAGLECIEINEGYVEELGQVPCELITVPIMIQFLLDQLCGEDGYIPSESETMLQILPREFLGEAYLYNEDYTPHDTVSLTLHTPNWSEILELLDDDIRKALHIKMKELDVQYDMMEEKVNLVPKVSSSVFDLFGNPAALFPKNRLQSPNILNALNFSSNGGFAGMLWLYYNQTPPRKPSTSSDLSLSLSYQVSKGTLFLDYCLYVLWMTKVPCILDVKKDLDSRDSNESIISRLDSKLKLIEEMKETGPLFTITNCIRNILSLRPLKKYMGKEFFQSPDLKVISTTSMKAMSCFEFHNRRCSIADLVSKSFFSDINMNPKFLKDSIIDIDLQLFDEIRTFLGEEIFKNTDDFNFVEELNQLKMFEATNEAHSDYICMDHLYSELTDSIFIVFHNPVNKDSVYCKSFNVTLRTPVPLRDFFEYNLEDDQDWLAQEEDIYCQKLKEMAAIIPPNPFYFPTPDFRDFVDLDFMTFTSLKYQRYVEEQEALSKPEKKDEKKKSPRDKKQKKDKKEKETKEKTDKESKGKKGKDGKETAVSRVPSPVFAAPGETYEFDGYDVDALGVQFSGFTTVFFSPQNCSVRVELLERLYGDQELGLHIRQGGHVLHMYSYVCPRPYIIQPYIFHFTLKNEVVIGFSRRFITKYVLTEVTEYQPPTKNKHTSRNAKKGANASQQIVLKEVPVSVMDEEFAYDLKLSLPSGLVVETVRDTLKPCYIRQYYLERPEAYSKNVKRERSRCFLTNGSVVKSMLDDSIEILCNNTIIFEFQLSDLHCDIEMPSEGEEETPLLGDQMWILGQYRVTSVDCFSYMLQNGSVTYQTKLNMFCNTDMETRTCYYRRSDKTNYVFFRDGMLCVEYPDGTRISNTYIVEDYEIFVDCSTGEDIDEYGGENESLEGFISVHIKFIMEHEDYATVMYESLTREWTVVLPFDTKIKITSEGHHQGELDGETSFEVGAQFIQMTRKDESGSIITESLVDLSSFDENAETDIYCTTLDSTGKKFIVKTNAENYVSYGELLDYGEAVDEDRCSSLRSLSQKSEIPSSKSVISNLSLKSSGSRKIIPQIVKTGNCLDEQSRYFVLKRDLTGFEITNLDRVRSTLKNISLTSVDYSDIFPGALPLRYFAILSLCTDPDDKGIGKWKMKKITPRVRYDPRSREIPFRSTYADPPCWTHPFPKKKKKIRIPECLNSRIFIETKVTDTFRPAQLGAYGFSEMDPEPVKILSVLQPGIENLQKYFRRVASEDQEILKELYALGVQDRIDAIRRTRPINSEALEHYLKMSEYYLERQEYHKYMIRYQIVPNYFEHPAGMSFLILKDLADEVVKYCEEKTPPPLPTPKPSISGTEVEYNISFCKSFNASSLEYRPGLDSKSAPSQFNRPPETEPEFIGAKKKRLCKSEPAYHISYLPVETEVEKIEYTGERSDAGTDYMKRGSVCTFDSLDLNKLRTKVVVSSESSEEYLFKLDDLLLLGLL